MLRSVEQLRKDAEVEQGLRELRLHYGYQHLLAIFHAKYREAWEKLEDTEDPVARATIKAIRDILATIDDQVNLGKDGRDELQKLTDTGLL